MGHLELHNFKYEYNTELFETFKITWNGTPVNTSCVTTYTCHFNLTQVPGLAPHTLEVEITQTEGMQATKEEDFRLAW